MVVSVMNDFGGPTTEECVVARQAGTLMTVVFAKRSGSITLMPREA